MNQTFWKQHEAAMSRLFDLDLTVGSGNQFHDPGDAVSREHYLDRAYRLYAECKSTRNRTFSLNKVSLAQWVRRAEEGGKIFIMPVRFVADEARDDADYVVMKADDLAEIIGRIEGLCK